MEKLGTHPKPTAPSSVHPVGGHHRKWNNRTWASFQDTSQAPVRPHREVGISNESTKGQRPEPGTEPGDGVPPGVGVQAAALRVSLGALALELTRPTGELLISYSMFAHVNSVDLSRSIKRTWASAFMLLSFKRNCPQSQCTPLSFLSHTLRHPGPPLGSSSCTCPKTVPRGMGLH